MRCCSSKCDCDKLYNFTQILTNTLDYAWHCVLTTVNSNEEIVKTDDMNATSSGWNTEKLNQELQDMDIPQTPTLPIVPIVNTRFNAAPRRPTRTSNDVEPSVIDNATNHPSLPVNPTPSYAPDVQITPPTSSAHLSQILHPPPPPPGFPFPYTRYCQTKVMQLWQLLSSNVKKADKTLYGDLWLPPNEDEFIIDAKCTESIKTILALRTIIWPPSVSKILLICVKKIPCGRDDSCLRRLRDQTRWMKNDLLHHVAAYKSFRQLKCNNVDYWYLSRHSCEFNLERFINSPLFLPPIAEFLVRDMFMGLDYLHTQSQHLFHGNLKPSNVLIDMKTDGQLSLILVDFGFGRLRCPKVSSLNDVPCYFGTRLNELCWKPPEFFDSTDHWTAAPKYDTPSDVYSGALLVYYMLSGRHPFVNRYDMTLMHLRRLMHEELHNLSDIVIELKTALRPLFYHDAKSRPKASDVLKQIVCWTCHQRMKFIMRVADSMIHDNRLGTTVGMALLSKTCHVDPAWARQLPMVVWRRLESIVECSENNQISVAALIIAAKLYKDAKKNNEISVTWTCPWLPDDEYHFWSRHPNLFWEVFRTINADPEWKTYT